MGHLVGKDIYRRLGGKIDNLTMRAPWNERLYAILKELYTADEAEVAIRMPYGLCTLDDILPHTRYTRDELRKILDGLCAKGLVVDLWRGNQYRYVLSPMVIGIFEFTMMRTGENLNVKEWARLFHDYMSGDDSFYAANFGKNIRVSPLRTLPHEEAVEKSEYVEVLDYEKATALIENAGKFAIGICSCRHEKLHIGQKTCAVPLDMCSTFDGSAEYMTRHGFARSVSRSEMLENLARAREMNLVLCADNVQRGVSFICFCCGCCCNVLQGISRFGYPHTVVTSSLIASVDQEECTECATCVESCPIHAVTIRPEGGPEVDKDFCLGCGICTLACPAGAMTLSARKQRVLHPESTFERIILQCLERGTLQNFLFTDPQRLTHAFLRAFLGAFLRIPPVKRALMTETLRSSFLALMKRGA